MSANGPGKSFRTGITILDAAAMFKDNETAEKWFISQRWPDGVTCPKCESSNIQERPTRKPQPFRCRSCRFDFSVKSLSLMHGSKLGLHIWGMALYNLTTGIKGTSSMKLHRDLGISQKAAWHLAHRIRESWEDDTDNPFAGPIEADEAYFGGREGNKHSRKKLNAGRGSVGKTPVIGVRDRETNQVKAEVVDKADKRTIQGFVVDNTSPDAKVYTDEASMYTGIPREHEAVRHSVGEYVRGQASTNGMESFWALMKRGYIGTYHKMSPKHLHRYVAEFEGRHNDRPLDTVTQMVGMVRGMEGKQLRYEDLTAPDA